MAISFEITGAAELAEEMKRMVDEYPDEVNTAMRKVAKGFCNDVNAQFPGRYSRGKRPFAKNWKTTFDTRVFGVIDETTIANKSPHWHLVENGHRAYNRYGHFTGKFVPGKHYAERTRADYEERYPEIVDAAITAALRKAGLK